MNREEWVKALEKFTEGNDFNLNPDRNFANSIIDGVLAQEKSFGLKLCPCRLTDGSREMTLSLLCPCNFKALKAWDRKGECWCGLFVKKFGSLR
jgi:ferredoxin-thioredoxin reductase catalytic chain